MYFFSETQMDRLAVLGARREDCEGRAFETTAERNKAFQELEKKAAAKNKETLMGLLNDRREPRIAQMAREMTNALTGAGFAQMLTPTIIPYSYLERMSVTAEHPLYKQVFRVDSKTCLRPMLAPGLYALSQKLLGIAPLPLRMFEIGSCFRKESEGKLHLKEFTMLNLVEWGTPEGERDKRIRELAALVLDAAGIEGYRFENEVSAVYGDGTDIVDKLGTELASSSMGPHPLDCAWNISCSWVGIGIGLERLAAAKENSDGVRRYARSVSFIDGATLSVK